MGTTSIEWEKTRRDPLVRSQLEAATARLGRNARVHVATAARRPRTWPTVVLLAATVCALTLETKGAEATGGRSVFVSSVNRFVHASPGTRVSGDILVPTLRGRGPRDEAAREMAHSQRAAMRAALACTARESLPAHIEAAGAQGPSAGLAFALRLVDVLIVGDLAPGRRVAVTGTIGAGGRVGRVLAVPAKARAAELAGADLMLVPSSQVEQARSSARRLEVAGVRNLDDAVRLVGGRGCVRGGRR